MQEGKAPKGFWFLLFCLGFIAGVALFSFRQHWVTPEVIDYYIGQEVEVAGVIVSEPALKGKTIVADLRVDQFADKSKVKGKLKIRTGLFPRLNYGDYVLVTCTLERPENTTFNYQRYLARYNIYALCFSPRTKKLGEGRGNSLHQLLINLKNSSIDLIEKHIGEPESSLIIPVLFGGADLLDDDLVTDFRRTGLTHIMAVSGFNVAILAAGLGYFLFLLGLSRRFVFSLTSLGTISYVILVGAPASAVRAGVMSIIILYSLTVGRLARFINIIILTAAGTLIINPSLLVADIGWQLSFAAVLGLLYLYPILKKILQKITPRRLSFMADVLAATLAAQLSTTPITLYNFGQVSLIAPLSNLLVVWTIPFLTAASAIALPIAALIPAFGDLLFLPSLIVAKYILWIVSLLARLDWAVITVDI